MESLYKLLKLKVGVIFVIILGLECQEVFSQETVLWTNPIANNVAIAGVAPTSGVTVTATTSGVSGNYTFQVTPANSTMFQGRGPWPAVATTAADDLTFTFSQPVIVTNFVLGDVNTSNGTPGWNDSFTIVNAGFATSVPNNVNVSPTGVILNHGINNVNTARFLCSNPIGNFGMQFQYISNTTTAWLDYRIDLIPIPVIDPICFNDVAPSFPEIGNSIEGTWSPSVIDTSIIGVTTYVFTPGPGQALTCDVPVDVTILSPDNSECCLSNLTLSSTADDISNDPSSFPIGLRHRSVSDYIDASNKIAVGDNVFQNGVVYHAGNYVVLTPGFDALYGSQFSGYIEGCSPNFNYKNGRPKKDNISNLPVIKNSGSFSGSFAIIPNPSNYAVEIVSENAFNKLDIISLEGRKMFESAFNETKKYSINISNYEKGVYLVIVTDIAGQQFSKKLIKN